jgi:hypothetical protein
MSDEAAPAAEDLVAVDVLLDGEWVPIDVDVQGLSFREADLALGELGKLAVETVRTKTLLAAWVTYRRTHPDVAVDVFLDLPLRALREGEREPVGETQGAS